MTDGENEFELTDLQTDGPLDFTALKKWLQIIDGVLGLHPRTQEDNRYIDCRKAFVGRRPKSTHRITGSGRRALANYLDMMQKIIDSQEV